MTTLPASSGVMTMLLILDKPLNAAKCFLSKVSSYLWSQRSVFV